MSIFFKATVSSLNRPNRHFNYRIILRYLAEPVNNDPMALSPSLVVKSYNSTCTINISHLT